MKKVLTIALFFIAFVCNSQSDEQRKNSSQTFMLKAELSDMASIGGVYEYRYSGEKNSTQIFGVSLISAVIERPLNDVTGTGFTIDAGHRIYYSKKKKDFLRGWYGENTLQYGNVSFSDNTFNFDGTYSYFSLFNTSAGYRFGLSENLIIDLYGGFNWRWEFKGKGDVDSKEFENLVPRLGVSLGYSF